MPLSRLGKEQSFLNQKLHSRSFIKSQLIELGIGNSSALMLHASIRKIGPIQGGAEALLDIILGILPENSALLMPLGSNDGETFDAKRSVAEKDIGVLAEIFRCREETLVNDHAAGRFGAIGKLSLKLLNPTPLNDYHGPGSLLDRFTQMNGLVLRVGADLDTVTLTHYAEYLANIPNKKRVKRKYVRSDTGVQIIESLDDTNGIFVWEKDDYFSQIMIDYLAEGRATVGKIGNSVAELFRAQDFVHYSVQWLESNFS